MYRSEKHPQIIHWWWGCPDGCLCLPPYILFFTTVCAETLCSNCTRKRLQITQMYAERLRLATSPRELGGVYPRLTPRNGLCLGGRRITLIAHLFGFPRIPRLRVALASKNGGGALGTTWKPGAASSRAVLGRSGFFLEGVSAEISAVQLSRLLLSVSPGASNFCPPQRGGSSGLAVSSAPAEGRPANRCQAHCPR